MCWFQGVYELTKVLLRNYPKIGHVSVELIATMSWGRRLCDHSCLPSRHHPNEESWKDSRLIYPKYREWFKLINTQSAQVVPRGTKCSHGMVSIVHSALFTNPCSTWEFFVGLGMFPWSCVKRKIPYNPWRMTSSGDRHQVCCVQVQVEQHEEWLTHSGVWGSNQLVFIEPTQSRKVVQLEGVKIVFI